MRTKGQENMWESSTEDPSHGTIRYCFGKIQEVCWCRIEKAEDEQSISYAIYRIAKVM